jgi:hypothetical protein
VRQDNPVKITARTELIFANHKVVGFVTVGFYVEEGTWTHRRGEWELDYHTVSPDFINREDAVEFMACYKPSVDSLLGDR